MRTKPKFKPSPYPVEVKQGVFYWECKSGIEIHSRIDHREMSATVVTTIPWSFLKDSVKRCT